MKYSGPNSYRLRLTVTCFSWGVVWYSEPLGIGRFRSVVFGTKKQYGWDSRDVLGTTFHQLLKTVFPVLLEVIQQELRANEHWTGQLIHVCRDGSRVTVGSWWDLKQISYSQDRGNTVIETNGPLPRFLAPGISVMKCIRSCTHRDVRTARLPVRRFLEYRLIAS